ncbi:MAG: ATP-binding cassette domain-containing protein [Bifidobacteriaceae bacterium]|nr:ATP-binding cassette domain-containing protein [Bifidobacteriaceae bacterium]
MSELLSTNQTHDSISSVNSYEKELELFNNDPIAYAKNHRERVFNAPTVLRVRDLYKSFHGLQAVNNISFDLHQGEVISFIGPNGSGKSTMINLISGFLKPDSGIIDINERSVAGLTAVEISEAGLARTFQNGRVFGALNVEENIALGYHKKLHAQRPFKNVQGYPIIRWLSLLAETGVALFPSSKVQHEKRDVQMRVNQEIDRFKERLDSRRKDSTYTLSYANRRRTEIARAHISEPVLLLLDEPTAGMNQSETAEVLEQLQYLKAQGHTILLVEHKMDLVYAISDRVIAMDGGRIIAQGDPDTVRSSAQVIEAYLGKSKELNTVRLHGQSRVLSTQNALENNSFSEQKDIKFDDNNTLLKLDSVNIFYGQFHALQNVSINVPEGSIVSLLGGNASGKSTTMKTILGLEQPKTGSIWYDGEDITRLSTRTRVSRGIAAVPESRRIFPQMTVEENLYTGAYTRNNRAEIQDSLALMYERFTRLKERRTQYAGTMSGGEQQMLAFARALMSKPKLICMDEPTMGLSPKLVEEVLEQIASLRDELHISVLMVEQQAQLALSIADYGYVLQNGRIRLQGVAQDLLHNEQVQEAYLGGKIVA